MPKSIEDYQIGISKQNKKLFALLSEVNAHLHLSLNNHDNDSVKVMDDGLKAAIDIIEYIAD